MAIRQPLSIVEDTDEEMPRQAPAAPRRGGLALRVSAGIAGVAAAAALAGQSWQSARQPSARQHARAGDSVQLIDRSQWKMGDPNWWNTKCPGQIPVGGFKEPFEMVNSYFTVPHQQAGAAYAVKDGEASDTRTKGVADTVKVSLSGRSFFADSCASNDHSEDDDPGIYDDVKYAKLKLLNKTLKYTVNMHRVGCGWNAALALTETAHNSDPTKCKDYFCDSLGTCGVRCAEINLQEANNRAWFSTLHVANDGKGVGVGYGGGAGYRPRRDWDNSTYGPRSKCINTTKPFQVAVSFPVNGSTGQLASVDVKLSQDGCSVHASIKEYASRAGKDSMAEITKALERGVTPTFQVWASTQMYWLDGPGPKGDGPCRMEEEIPNDGSLEDQDYAEWSDFSVVDLEAKEEAKKPKGKPHGKPHGKPKA